MGVIVVTGIPGVGKTTVMKQAAEGIDINKKICKFVQQKR